MIGNYLNLSNKIFIEEMYQQWLQNPTSMSNEWTLYFQQYQNDITDAMLNTHSSTTSTETCNPQISYNTDHAHDKSIINSNNDIYQHLDKHSHAYKQSRVNALMWAFRDIGYLYARLNPLKGYITPDLWYMMFAVEGNYETLTLKEFGLSESDLNTPFLTGRFIPEETLTLQEIITRMKHIYCGTFGIEILHIKNKVIRHWLINRLEGSNTQIHWHNNKQISFQQDLIRAEEFEHFIHTNFIGQKRFSLEGGETLIPVLRHLFDLMARSSIEEAVLGMAHRGRLNVFVNSMGKPAMDIFARFVDNYVPHTYGGSGDVKYHLGFSTDYIAHTPNNTGTHSVDKNFSLHISLVPNPSHLEAVNPVVEGKTRGIQHRIGDRHRKKVVPILIHGDSAFSGQGVVTETLNLSQLKGYRTGGTIHIVVNNQIGFTTASRDSRSTFFATDIAKSIAIPIIHVNGDDPESAIRAIELAFHFRQKFSQDIIVDLICYRRLGHNEADEPSFSHPKMYNHIKTHKTTRQLYGKKLADEGIWSLEEQAIFSKTYNEELKQHLKKAHEGYEPNMNNAYQGEVWKNFNRKYNFNPIHTGINKEELTLIAQKLTTIPEDFHIHPKLKRFTSGRENQFFKNNSIDWAFAESLAFASLLIDGHPIRLSGEDCGRGTFSQRHAIWWDIKSSKPKFYIPLRNIHKQQAQFSVYDSPLSEFSVLGFDYGYSLTTPNSLTIWEGQFGDFVNGAQVIIDQFIVSAETKWFRSSGLVMLLPHGYEGQGPEHSSAFLERFLSLCANDNIQVVNATTPAQYFHVLRRQIKQKYRKPLIIMSPKSLLRHKECISTISECSNGHFQTLIDDTTVEKKEVTRILLCSGKIYYNLIDERRKKNIKHIAIIRIEQAYPFPSTELKTILEKYSSTKNIYWVQEETENRGLWLFIQYRQSLFTKKKLHYIGRPASASPATGSHKQHIEELQNILKNSFK